MNEKDNFALVPRPPGALEKAEPGAKRILSGMVADTLALVKREPQSKTVFFAAMCGFVWNPKQFDEIIADNLLEFVPASKGKVELKCFTWTNELINATRRLRFDLFILLLNPHLYCWKSQNEAPVRENLDVGDMSNTRETNAYELIASLKREFKKPILAVSNGYYSTTELEAAGADAVLGMPFNSDKFRSALEACGILQAADLPSKTHPRKVEKTAETAPQPSNKRALRIVVLDDEEGPRRSCVVMLKNILHHGVEILEFEDARDAWQELSHTDPDLFITDIQHVGISCKEMLTRLAERKVKYPILVISAVLGVYEDSGEPVWVQAVRRDWSPNLNVSFLSKPYTYKEFRTAFEATLKITAQRAP